MGCFSIWSLNEVVDVLESPDSPEIEPFSDIVCLDDPESSFQLCLTEASIFDGGVYNFYNGEDDSFLGTSTDRCIEIFDLSSFSEGTNFVYAISQSGICRSLPGNAITVQMTAIPLK